MRDENKRDALGFSSFDLLPSAFSCYYLLSALSSSITRWIALRAK